MSLGIKKIFLTYLLCVLIIPIVLNSFYGAVFGTYAGQKLGKNQAKINLLAKERGLEFKKHMSPEETKQLQQIISEANNIDFDKMIILGFVFALLMAGIQGFYAGFLLKSNKHLYIIAGCILVYSLAHHMFTHSTQPLVHLFLITCILILSGYVGINWKVIQDD